MDHTQLEAVEKQAEAFALGLEDIKELSDSDIAFLANRKTDETIVLTEDTLDEDMLEQIWAIYYQAIRDARSMA